MTAIDDLRTLSTVDRRHHLRAQDATDRWFDQFTTLSEKARDGTVLVAVNLKHPSPCPVDKADMQIVHWLTNLDADKRMIQRAYVRIITAIHGHMISVGATRVWGVVRERNDHLTALLQPLLDAGIGKRIDLKGTVEGWYYVGGLDVDTFMRSPSAEGGSR